jgi:hypothetical protein
MSILDTNTNINITSTQFPSTTTAVSTSITSYEINSMIIHLDYDNQVIVINVSLFNNDYQNPGIINFVANKNVVIPYVDETDLDSAKWITFFNLTNYKTYITNKIESMLEES